MDRLIDDVCNEIKSEAVCSQSILVKKFKHVPLQHQFFDSFREVYGDGFDEWAHSKKEDDVYFVESRGHPVAFMKLKVETEDEDYSDMEPVLSPCRRLKICSFKVALGNNGLSQQLMEIADSVARFHNCRELYGTVAVNSPHRKQTLKFFCDRMGFQMRAIKKSHGGLIEDVICRKLNPTTYQTNEQNHN